MMTENCKQHSEVWSCFSCFCDLSTLTDLKLLQILKSDNYREETSLFHPFNQTFDASAVSVLKHSATTTNLRRLGFGCRCPCTSFSAAHMWVPFNHTSSWALLHHKTKGGIPCHSLIIIQLEKKHLQASWFCFLILQKDWGQQSPENTRYTTSNIQTQQPP